MMLDRVGIELHVGDSVIMIKPGYRELTIAEIKRFTAQFVFLDYYHQDRLKENFKQKPDQLIKHIPNEKLQNLMRKEILWDQAVNESAERIGFNGPIDMATHALICAWHDRHVAEQAQERMKANVKRWRKIVKEQSDKQNLELRKQLNDARKVLQDQRVYIDDAWFDELDEILNP